MMDQLSLKNKANAVQPLVRPATEDVREHFIPIRKYELIQTLAGDSKLNQQSREKLLRLCDLVQAIIHYHFHERLCSLKNTYASFNPDADTIVVHQATMDEEDEQLNQFFAGLKELLERANYRQLTKKEIDAALADAGHWGFRLDVDFSIFKRLEIYARGVTTKSIHVRPWWRLFRLVESQREIYQRLVIILQLHQHARLPHNVDTHTVHAKIFKNIPKMDLESLLPGARIKMSLLDSSKTILPGLGAISWTVFKIVNAALAAVTLSLATVMSLLGLAAGTLGYGAKTFLGYLRTKEKHQYNLTKNLYFQNLDNNAGVFFRLLDEAEEQEFREAILAYFLLWQRAPLDGWTQNELNDAAERYLRDQFEVNVDFEASDALKKLGDWKLVASHDGRIHVVDIDEALACLDRQWDNFFPYNKEQCGQ